MLLRVGVGGSEAPERRLVFAKRVGVVRPIECEAEARPSRWSIARSGLKAVAPQGNGSARLSAWYP
jgi:hypothetical protein